MHWSVGNSTEVFENCLDDLKTTCCLERIVCNRCSSRLLVNVKFGWQHAKMSLDQITSNHLRLKSRWLLMWTVDSFYDKVSPVMWVPPAHIWAMVWMWLEQCIFWNFNRWIKTMQVYVKYILIIGLFWCILVSKYIDIPGIHWDASVQQH